MAYDLEAIAANYARRFDDACLAEQEPEFRNHLGASSIGQDCLRSIWMGFRWIAKISARQAYKKLKEQGYTGEDLEHASKGVAARIFATGHNEEPHFYSRLERSGVQFVVKQEKLQLLGGHYGGTNDGRIVMPELDGQFAILELKTMNRDNFTQLVAIDSRTGKRAGIKTTKEGYYRQVQVYMRELGVAFCLFIVLCKDDSRTHFEIIEADAKVGADMQKRALFVIKAQEPPPRISDNSSFWKCKFCDYLDHCHNGVPAEINCRSCKHAMTIPDGWRCQLHGGDIPKEFLTVGCPNHLDILSAIT